MKKRAIISVYDKSNIVEFAKELTQKYGYEIISTGGTYNLLKGHNINVVEVAEVTQFKEMLEGKVKTLHPNIHAGILASKDQQNELIANKIDKIDMVVVNLYPFEEASQDENMLADELSSYIDIGGVTLLRAGAKNYNEVCVVSSPDFYEAVLDNLKENSAQALLNLRKDLALKAFELTSKYDALISEQMSKRLNKASLMPCVFSYCAQKVKDLRYGENPHQNAAIYKNTFNADYEVLNGKELSFNNIVDMASAMNIVSEFADVPCSAIIKHNNPCGVALGSNIYEAFLKAFDCDPISAFGGIAGFSQTLTVDIAKYLSQVFMEVIIAPDFEDEALEILKKKKNLRVVKLNTALTKYKRLISNDIKVTPFGTLVQSVDNKEIDKDLFKVVTKNKPSVEQIEDMVFTWKVAKHTKSNAIVIAKDLKTLGIGVGQTSRVGAMAIAMENVCDTTKEAVIASDGFFPAIDNIQVAAQGRIAAIIQPGGSIKDQDVIDACDKYKIAMITTSIRHFRH